MRTVLLKRVRKNYSIVDYDYKVDGCNKVRVLNHKDRKIELFNNISEMILRYYESTTSILFDFDYRSKLHRRDNLVKYVYLNSKLFL